MYYDVVVNIYEEKGENNCCDVKVGSYSICGGFKTEDEAMEYINDNEINEYKYCYSDEEYPCIEIEEYNEDGSFAGTITVE